MTDLLGLLQQIEMAWAALFQSTTSLLKALAGLLVAALLVWTAYTRLRDQFRKKRKATRGRKLAPKQAASANMPSDRQRAVKTDLPHRVTSHIGVQSPTEPASESNSTPDASKSIVRAPAASLQAPSAPVVRRPHLEPIVQSDDENSVTPDSQPSLSTEKSENPSNILARDRPIRRVEFIDVLPWHADYPARKPAATALAAASELVKIAVNLRDVSQQQTQSISLYARQLKFLLILADALRDVNRQAAKLDRALGDLDKALDGHGLTWDDQVPLLVLISYLDPFASRELPRSPDDMRVVFSAEAERIAEALDNMGLSVQRSPELSVNGPWVRYSLTPPTEP